MILVAAPLLGGYVVVAAAQQSVPNNLFTAAGFTIKYADTPEKLALLRRLPADKLVTRTRNGKIYYIYADPGTCRCAYVGTLQAYQAYQSGAGGPQFDLSGGKSREDQMIDAFNEDDTPAQPGAPSFNDYVFGGIADD
jgi:hypothetical protein